MTSRRRLPPYRPQLALLVSGAPEGAAWVHEVKYDGYRIGCAVDGGEVTLWSRRGKDWTAQFPEVASSARRLKVRSALLDGEVAAVLPDGRTSFQALQNAFHGGRRDLVYFAFDLLHLDGEDLTSRPLLERKAALAGLLGDGGVVRYAPHFEGRGPDVHREACKLGMEGIVSKRSDLPYRAGRNATWVKTKCVLRQELVIGGFTDPEGAARDAIGALLVGYREGGALRFAGKVGTGFTNASARALRERLAGLPTDSSPFTPRPSGWLGRNAHWVRPELVCEVAFTEWTADGKIRHPSFQGLREDKRPEDVVRERAAGGATSTATSTATPTEKRVPRRSRSPGAGEAEEIGGVRISSPARVMYPDLGVTKRDLARYYEAVADAMVPHLAGRPLTLVHCPDGLAGECRYMKHSKLWAPDAVRRVRIPERTKLGEYLVVDDARALLSIVQMDVLELHTWSSTVDRLEEPDRLVLDLDPGPAVGWAEVVRAARLLRDALAALGLGAFVKTTGGAGLHVVAPLVPERPWSECLAFARGLATTLARHDPSRFTVAYAKAGRERKILLDYLRNNRTNTSIAAFSTRARPAATVAVPLAWDELSPRAPPDRHTLRTVPRRLARLRADPWAGYDRARRSLARSRLDAVGASPAP
ncbi:DNA ligase D [Anaeromyxobacter sp. Fw109-5]|uniref:DNA ligase D n=1 Tax=Anaeromyxobacter sp. (strain Fw109-5) TaxID=404589 RepID=UPI001180049E|nr:DNA ligase D [Anaeromyxobacter sp. Fw109-5]